MILVDKSHDGPWLTVVAFESYLNNVQLFCSLGGIVLTNYEPAMICKCIYQSNV